MMNKKFNRCLLAAFLAVLFSNYAGFAQIPDADSKRISDALPASSTVPAKKARQLLVFSLSEGYQHGAIPYAAKTLELMGKKTGAFTVVHSTDMNVFKPESLNQYDAICFNNTTQLKFEDPALRKSLMDFVKGGKGIIGVHAATDNFYDWPEAAEMMGGVFDGHPWNSSGTWRVMIEDKNHPLTRAFAAKDFSVKDEIYRTRQRNLRENSRVLLRLDMHDEATKSAEKVRITDRDIPVSWIRTFEKGRVFYCSLGHNSEIYWTPAILQHYLDGIQYALGDLSADATPVPFDASQAVNISEVKSLLKLIAPYQYGDSRENMTNLSELLKVTRSSKSLMQAIEQAFIEFLESDATLPAKQFICEQLSLIGSDASVEVLEDMLEDAKTFEMALFALERIPGKEADEVLIEMLDDAEGKAKIGIITALGNRRITAAESDIRALLEDDNPEVRDAALAAGAKIGGAKLTAAITAQWQKNKTNRAITEAYLQCADNLAANAAKNEAFAIYKSIYGPDQPKQVQYTALRGMILTSESNASQILLDVLKSDQKDMHASAIQLVREIPADEDASAIASALPTFSASGQIQLITALSGRAEPAVLKAIMDAAGNPDESIRLAALAGLAKCANAGALPLLAETAASKEGKEKNIARESLYRINAPDIDSAILKNMGKATPAVKTEYIRAIAERRIPDGLPALFETIEKDAQDLRLEAIKAIRTLAVPQSIDNATHHLANPKSEPERTELEKAVVAIAAQIPEGNAKISAALNAYAGTKDPATRASLLQVAGKVGDPQALPVLRQALKDKNADIQAAAIRALSDWPDAAPLNDLLAVAKSSKNQKFRVLALRGYVKLISYESAKSSEEIVAMYRTAMSLATNNEEKRQVLSGLSAVASEDALTFTGKYLDDATLQEEAATTLINIASDLDEDAIIVHKPLLLKALGLLSNEDLKESAQSMINQMERFEDHITLWQIAGPYDQQDMDLFDYAFAPETAESKSVKWEKCPTDSDPGNYWHINLSAIYGNNGMVAYLRTYVFAPADLDVRLEMGSNDAIKAWVNDLLVHGNDTARGISPGEDKVVVSLKKGWNTLMIKIINVGGAWGGSARIRNTNGSHIDGLKFSIDK